MFVTMSVFQSLEVKCPMSERRRTMVDDGTVPCRGSVCFCLITSKLATHQHHHHHFHHFPPLRFNRHIPCASCAVLLCSSVQMPFEKHWRIPLNLMADQSPLKALHGKNSADFSKNATWSQMPPFIHAYCDLLPALLKRELS